MFIFLLITLISILSIYLIKVFLSDLKAKTLLLFIIFSESIVLTFLFEKFPFFLSFIISIFSFYMLVSVRFENDSFFTNNSSITDSKLQYFKGYFHIIGFVLIFNILIYEYFADRVFSSNTFVVFY